MPTAKQAAIQVTGAILAIAAVATPRAAHADIITALAGPATAVAGGYAYTYNVELTGDQQLDPSTTDPNPQFGTVYDFGTVVGGLAGIGATGVLATDFTFSLDNTDTSAFETAPVDAPSLTNIRFTYTGTTAYAVNGSSDSGATLLPASVDNLGTFSVVSPYASAATPLLQYDGEAMKASNDTITGNVGLTTGPALPSPVPEPASLLILASGLVGFSLLRR